MEVFITIYTEIITGQNNIKTQIKNLQAKINSLPEGDLHCIKNGKYIKWFVTNRKTTRYIPKKERPLAEALALKKFYQFQMNELTVRSQLLENALHSQTNALSLLEETSCFKELLEPHFHTFSKELQQWANADYEHNPRHPEHLTHQTISGYKVRSKSEVIIANTLFTNHIPFRYECILAFQDIHFYPDFTIRHPKTGEITYWEHFGMMDKPAYCENTFNKLKIYATHQIIPSINLITTYETQNTPLNSEKIQQIVYEYFF